MRRVAVLVGLLGVCCLLARCHLAYRWSRNRGDVRLRLPRSTLKLVDHSERAAVPRTTKGFRTAVGRTPPEPYPGFRRDAATPTLGDRRCCPPTQQTSQAGHRG